MKVFLVQGSWLGWNGVEDPLTKPYPIHHKFESDLSELQQAVDDYKAEIDGTKKRDYSKPWDPIQRFPTDAYKTNVLEELKNNGKAIIPQTGDTEGWGLSFNSMDEAIEILLPTIKAYEDQKLEQANTEKQERRALAASIRAIPADTLDKKVYYYFKQDYNYRAMHSTYQGEATLRQVAEFSLAWIESEDDEHIVPQEEYWDWNELVIEQHDAVLVLLKEGSVITTGEIGYHALSLNSADEARSLVKEAFVEAEF